MPLKNKSSWKKRVFRTCKKITERPSVLSLAIELIGAKSDGQTVFRRRNSDSSCPCLVWSEHEVTIQLSSTLSTIFQIINFWFSPAPIFLASSTSEQQHRPDSLFQFLELHLLSCSWNFLLLRFGAQKWKLFSTTKQRSRINDKKCSSVMLG